MFSAKHLQVGASGENIAKEFLKKKGFRIITQNYKTRWGEIDVIAIRKDKTLVFVEVKTLASYNKEIRQENFAEDSLKPEDNLTHSKLLKLKKSCEYFANRNPNLVNDQRGWQIDLITLIIPKNETGELLPVPLEIARARSVSPSLMGLTNNEEDFVIKHYENIHF